MSLCVLELKQKLIKFAISSHTALKLDVHALRSYLKLLDYSLFSAISISSLLLIFYGTLLIYGFDNRV